MALETIADAQLKFFKQEARKTSPAHSICQTGLWRWSRHPNYLGQWILWVAYGLLAINHHNAWVFVYAPLLMGYFLTYMTGIRLTEAHMLATRGEPYRQYQERTAPFISGLQWPNFTPKS
jgi:steroid 5-alpha reductase family enzyme